MKNVVRLLPILLIFSCWNAFGQTRVAKPTAQRKVFTLPQADIQVRQETDTIFFPAAAEECGNLVTSYEVSEVWGFVAGTNGYGDLEKAQRLVYTNNSPYVVREVWGFFAYASAVDTGNLRMKIYRVDAATGGPAELLATSEDIRTSDIQTDTVGILPTIFAFEDSVVLNDTSFFASLDLSDLYEAEDTVALFMTNDTCGRGADAWELFSDGATWLPINDRNSWQLNANWIIAAVVEFNETTDVDDPFVAQKGLRIFPPSPNPTNNWVNLPFQLDNTSTVDIEIYSTNGALLQRLHLGQKLPGQHTVEVDVQSLPPGAYVYGIITNEARLMSRFVVSH
ncbi:MAG: T9SS type A sorting domain-containing protein [Saprospiraceae bacterium]